MKKTGSILLFLILAGMTPAQHTLYLHPQPGTDIHLFDYKQKVRNKAEARKELNNFLKNLYDQAFLLASYDSIHSDSLQTNAWIRCGKKYTWARLGKGNVDEGLLNEIGFREKYFTGKPIHYAELRRMEEKLLRSCENNGYPFAEIRLDSIHISGDELFASLKLSKNKLVRIDSVVIKGNPKIAPVYIYSALGIKPGDLYNESRIAGIEARLREIPFVKSIKPYEVIFTDKSTTLYLYLDKKKASQLDGILGLAPDPLTGKVTFTGDARIKLLNFFNRGDLIDLNWKKLPSQAQSLNLKLAYPYILSSPFGIAYTLNIFKKDTTYLDATQQVDLSYLISKGNVFKIFVNNKSSSLLSTSGLMNITTLPVYADVNSLTYGLGFSSARLDYRLNPRKGYTFSIAAGAGDKTIRQNANVNPLVYENLKLKSTQYNADLLAEYYYNLKGRNVIKTALRGSFLSADNMFQNELFRIGGLQNLRGFDEESIYASTYGIFTLEYHYILDQNSYLFAFGDGSWYENSSINKYVHDNPFGVGAGITFDTKTGIFSISYAVGKQFDNPFSLKSGKINFGFLSLF
ncbi:MAG: POTRA domain-containing protein [Bacteroidia bacterium]